MKSYLYIPLIDEDILGMTLDASLYGPFDFLARSYG